MAWWKKAIVVTILLIGVNIIVVQFLVFRIEHLSLSEEEAHSRSYQLGVGTVNLFVGSIALTWILAYSAHRSRKRS